MTRVDFYILQEISVDAQLLFACRLVDKAMRRGNRVFINVVDLATARILDELLWSFRPESFIPHAIINTEDAAEVPVVISPGQDQAGHHDLLINLTADLPEFFSRFQRMAEVVVQNAAVLEATRRHYTFFRSRGYPLETHRL